MSIKIENVDVFGFNSAIRGMRNPMNSWDKSDSKMMWTEDPSYADIGRPDLAMNMVLGDNDLNLMRKLVKGGTEHRKFLRMIHVQMDVTAPLYWWKEFDTYKVGTVTSSCSTMHKIHSKEFTFDDFSCEHLMGVLDCFKPGEEQPIPDAPVARTITRDDDEVWTTPEGVLSRTIVMLNLCRALYLKTNDKRYWWQMIQLLPSSYNQKRTLDFNYETAMTIIRQRTGHKLDEWHTFVDTLKELPHMKEFMEGEE
jgi:hypothetical protein